MKILLAVDLSPASQVAADEVATRPWPAGTSIEVVSVLDLPHLIEPVVIEDVAPRLEEMVQQVAARLGATGAVLEGNPKTVIVDHAKKMGADFIVVGSHNPTGIERFLLGSVAGAVVRHASCSVEVARAALPKNTPRKILLATDGSESSELAARSVARRPWPAGTEVRVFSAVELALTTFQSTLEPPFMNSETMETMREEAMKRAQNAIATAEQIVADAGLQTSESISVLVESPKQTIVEEASNWGADLIVVGSHGGRGLDRFLLGSVSEAVATHATCSVEVIRKTDL